MKNYRIKSKKKIIREILKLNGSEKTHKALYLNLSLCRQSTDINGIITDINPAWLKTLGYKKEEIIGNRFIDFLRPDFKEYFKKNFRKFKTQDYINDVKFYIRKKNGEYIYILFEGKIAYTPQGKFKQIYCTFKDITKLKIAEENIAKSETNLKALINNRKELIWSLDKDFNILIFNNVFAEICWKAYKIKLKKGMNALEILNTKLKTFWTPIYETALAGKTVNFEFSEEITGKQHYFEVSIEPMLLDNQIIGVSAISRDITEKRKIRQKLIESEEHYKTMLDDIPIGIAVHQDGKIAYINTKGVEIMHAEKANHLIGQSIFKFIPEKTYNHLAAQIKETLNGKKHLKPIEEKYIRYDGKVIDVEVTATPVEFNNKPAIQITVTDISERKEAERTLQISAERWEATFNAISDPVSIIDFDNNILQYNAATLPFFGLTDEEIKTKRYCKLIHNMSQPIKDCPIEKMKKSKHPETLIFQRGKQYLKVSVFPVLNAEKDIISAVHIVKDITERKKTETELKNYHYQLENLVKERTIEVEDKVQKLENSQKAMRYLLEDVNETAGKLLEVNRKLEESNRDLEAFAYSVSHDLKSPLRAVIGYTNVLQEDFSEQFSGNAEEFLNLVIKNSLNMNTLIDDLLLFARAGRNELDRSKFNLSILVNDVFNSLKQNYSDKKIELQIEEDVFINADIGSMKQIIFNLLNNALKFSKKKNQIKIEFGAKFIEGQNTYFIKDNGIGFDMKYHNKLFGVFQRLHTAEKYEETSIGLSLVKRIIEKHKGTIYAESELGKGSTFYFTVS